MFNISLTEKKWLTEKEKLLDHLNWEQNYLHFPRNIIFPWVNHRRTSYSHSEWKSHRHFLKNEWSVISRKTIGIIYCQWYNLIFHGENKNFRKLEFITASLAFSLVFKTFQMRLVALLIKLHFFMFHIMKYVNIWKIYIISWINIFQMTIVWFYEIEHDKISTQRER